MGRLFLLTDQCATICHFFWPQFAEHSRASCSSFESLKKIVLNLGTKSKLFAFPFDRLQVNMRFKLQSAGGTLAQHFCLKSNSWKITFSWKLKKVVLKLLAHCGQSGIMLINPGAIKLSAGDFIIGFVAKLWKIISIRRSFSITKISWLIKKIWQMRDGNEKLCFVDIYETSLMMSSTKIQQDKMMEFDAIFLTWKTWSLKNRDTVFFIVVMLLLPPEPLCAAHVML